MNSLAQHLVHLRGLPGALAEDGQRVAAAMPCDAATLRDLVRRGRHEDAAALYAGPFMDALTIPWAPTWKNGCSTPATPSRRTPAPP